MQTFKHNALITISELLFADGTKSIRLLKIYEANGDEIGRFVKLDEDQENVYVSKDGQEFIIPVRFAYVKVELESKITGIGFS